METPQTITFQEPRPRASAATVPRRDRGLQRSHITPVYHCRSASPPESLGAAGSHNAALYDPPAGARACSRAENDNTRPQAPRLPLDRRIRSTNRVPDASELLAYSSVPGTWNEPIGKRGRSEWHALLHPQPYFGLQERSTTLSVPSVAILKSTVPPPPPTVSSL